MTDNEITKTSGEISCNKIKAIDPHITVSGDVGKPYYNIDWYDIEKQTMYRGYSSYKLSLVRKWLQENFEIVDNDIDNLINRQKAEIDRLERLANHHRVRINELNKGIAESKAEAVREFAESIIFEIVNKPSEFKAVQATPDFLNGMAHRQHEILDSIKEMAGEG